tara:strand:+ start:1160 stop:1777 length:618 start_codon:yes stop_codon:yes gene_type:complete
MIHKFKIDDLTFTKLKNWSKDKSSKYSKELAGNLENEFHLTKYRKEFEPFILETVNNIEPLRNYLYNELFILSPNGLPLTLQDLWVNYQQKYEFNPVHNHGGIFSFILFIQIPYTTEEQAAVSPGRNSNHDCAGKLSFIYLDSNSDGCINTKELDVDKTWEGTGLIFKSNLSHCVYPFYTEGERITISGNLHFNTENLQYTFGKS